MYGLRILRNFGSQRFLITGASGQIGSELIPYISQRYGLETVVASDLTKRQINYKGDYEFVSLDDYDKFLNTVKDYKITHIIHLAAFLSARAERDLKLALDVNVRGAENALEAARQTGCHVYIPSTMAVFGNGCPRVQVPDEVVLQPTTVYGTTKVYMELLGQYYHRKFGVNFRSLRYPGAISASPPGGGTTDYAVEIFYDVYTTGKYRCFLQKDTRLPMIYMDDLLKGTCDLIDADEFKLSRRVYNLAAISFTPEELYKEIKKHIPHFKIEYAPDFRQQIANSWPESLSDQMARQDWGWNHEYDLEAMVKRMLKLLRS